MSLINPKVNTVTAFAPATCANVAVGFDILGFALDAVGDTVTLSKRQDRDFVIDDIQSKEKLPFDKDKNTASIVLQALCQDRGLDCGFSIKIRKGIPLSSGMGGSAASAVAALVACNAFLQQPLSPLELAEYALLGEEAASGQAHADNIVPCIYGGLTLIKSLQPLDVLQLPLSQAYCVLVHPHLQVSTKQARAALKEQIPLSLHVKQSALLATFIASLYQNDLKLLQDAFKDLVIEPQRAGFVPGFQAIKQAALDAGALGATLSGSGPSILALAKEESQAQTIAAAMQMQLKQNQLDSDFWIARMSKDGARVVEVI